MMGSFSKRILHRDQGQEMNEELSGGSFVLFGKPRDEGVR